MNRKIINASTTSIDGIKFRSKLESKMYSLLKNTTLKFSYEPYHITLVEAFFSKKPWIVRGKEHSIKQQDLTYTPDFVVFGKDTVYLIEVKGFPNDSYPIKRKLLLKWISENEYPFIFMELKNTEEMSNAIEYICKHEEG